MNWRWNSYEPILSAVMRPHQVLRGLAAAALMLSALALTACGGSQEPAEVPPATVVVTATDTVAITPPPVLTSTPATTATTSTTVDAGTSTTVATSTSTTDIPACSVAGQRYWLKSLIDDQYYWYDKQGTANDAATTMDTYFQSLLYKPTDRYSFTQTSESFVQTFATGRRTGYGYSMLWTDAALTNLRVAWVEPLSPVAAAGLQRGDTVLSIDDFTPAQIAAGALATVTQAGVPRRFRLRDLAGVERTITVNSADYAISPVLRADTFSVANNGSTRKIGYLAYQQFVDYSATALGQAFAGFAQAGVQDLILDLRYNGGGSVTMARDLSSMVGGATVSGKVFTQLVFNALHPQSNQTLAFSSDASLLPSLPLSGLTRVFVITSPQTASASELVINGLKPFLKVVLIGATTYGKPYGFAPRSWCDITYNAVNFEAFNAVGEGGYVNGITPTCSVADDFDHALGDTAERRIQAAISYAATGVCPAVAASEKAQAARGAGPLPMLGEAPPGQMFLR
jgi:C-terminal processing protease CtpA/Prc